MTPKRKLLLCVVLVVNGIGVAGVYVLLNLQIGVSNLYVVSTYRDLLENKVVSHNSEAMKRYHNGALGNGDDWMAIPEYLNDGSVTPGAVALVVALLCALNVVVLAAVLLKVEKENTQTAKESVTATGMGP